MKFVKYPSIPNINQNELDAIAAHGFDKESIEWVVSEKIHGVNFGIYCEGNTAIRATRNRFLEDGESFHGFDRDKTNAYLKKAQYILDQIKNKKEEHNMIIYGELFGGSYPHSEVPKQNIHRLQKGVFYCPDIQFIAFDIVLLSKFVEHDLFCYICEQSEIVHTPILFHGTLKECLRYPNEFQTKIPSLYGLPPVDNNVCEGVVIKPVNPLFFPCGSRVILKNKNKKFTEIQKEKRARPQPLEMSAAAQEAREFLLECINENRLHNVLSKMGEVTIKDFSQIAKEFSEDVLKENPIPHGLFTKEEQKHIKKLIGKTIAVLVRKEFL